MCVYMWKYILHMNLHDIPVSLLQRDKNVQDFIWSSTQHMVISGKPDINEIVEYELYKQIPKDVIPSGQLTYPTLEKNNLQRWICRGQVKSLEDNSLLTYNKL